MINPGQVWTFFHECVFAWCWEIFKTKFFITSVILDLLVFSRLPPNLRPLFPAGLQSTHNVQILPCIIVICGISCWTCFCVPQRYLILITTFRAKISYDLFVLQSLSHVQPDPGAQTISPTLGIESFLVVKRPGSDAGLSPHLAPRLKKEYLYRYSLSVTSWQVIVQWTCLVFCYTLNVETSECSKNFGFIYQIIWRYNTKYRHNLQYHVEINLYNTSWVAWVSPVSIFIDENR